MDVFIKTVFTAVVITLLTGCNESTQGTAVVSQKIEPFVCAFEKDHLPEVDPELDKQYQELRAYDKKKIPNKDEANLFNQYQLLADQGHWKAASQLAVRYLYGRGVEQSYFKALDWFQWMADRDIPLGYYNLAVLADKGIALEQNKEGAWHYYHRAAQLGNPQAQYRLADIYIYKRNEDAIGLEYHKCAANQGYAESYFALGAYIELMEKNYPKALYYYQAAAAAGRTGSMLFVGGGFEMEILVTRLI